MSIGNVSYPRTFQAPGYICFDATFESGNLGRVDAISPDEYDLFIRPDTCNNQYRVWFYFECKNAQIGQRVMFNVVNFSKTRTLLENGFATPVCLDERQSWMRIPQKNTFYYQSVHHGDRFILSFIYIFESTAPVRFAYCIPYTYTKLTSWLDDLERRRLTYFERSILCYTLQKRRVDMITIRGDRLRQTPVVVLTARVHPGETPSSFVLHGLVEFLLSSDTRAERLRANYTFRIIPMLNPDGVVLGNYRTWKEPVNWLHPSIHASRALLAQLGSNVMAPVEMYLDIHAHSQKTNSFVYGNVENDERQLWLPHLLHNLADDFSLAHTEFNANAGKEGTGRRVVGELVGIAFCYTLEVSFFSYRPNNSPLLEVLPYQQYKYEALGEALGIALLQKKELETGSRNITLSREYKTFVVEKKTMKEKCNLVKLVKSAADQLT